MHAPNSVKSLPLGLSSRAARTQEAPISFLIATALRNPGLINLAAGLVDPSTLPVEAVREVAQRVLSDSKRAREALQYDTTIGLTGLRQEALSRIEKLEGVSAGQMSLTPDNIVITTGSQQALFLVGDVLIDPGDIVIAAAPSYFVFTGALDSLGATILSVPMDEDGMDVAAAGRLLERVEAEGRLARVKFIYCTSYFQNPTGLTLSAERRPKLLEIAKRFSKDHRILILEDAAYRELRYDGPAHRSIKSFDSENRYTVLSQTFSKPFSPGLKLGYSAMPPDLLDAVLHEKGSHDFGSSSLTQHLALEAMRDGHYDRQVQRLCGSYRAKRDTVLASLQRFMPRRADLHWTHPGGGLYVWLTLPKSIDTSRSEKMFETCVDRGVLYVPGDYCFQADAAGKKPMNHIRLSFGQVDAAKIEPGIQILSGVVRELLENAA